MDFRNLPRPLDAPAQGSFVVTPSNSADLAQPVRMITIAAAGTIAWHDRAGNAQATAELPAGTYPMEARRILATGTTATGITGWV